MFNVLLIKAQNPKHFEMNDVNLHPHGGLAELVDCTGLENRRAARYRGFESLSLRQESVHDVGTFFLLHMGSRQAMQSPVQPLVNLNQ